MRTSIIRARALVGTAPWSHTASSHSGGSLVTATAGSVPFDHARHPFRARRRRPFGRIPGHTLHTRRGRNHSGIFAPHLSRHLDLSAFNCSARSRRRYPSSSTPSSITIIINHHHHQSPLSSSMIGHHHHHDHHQHNTDRRGRAWVMMALHPRHELYMNSFHPSHQ